MKTHAHFGGAVLCGKANAKSVPKWAFEKLPPHQCCKRCERVRLSLRGHNGRTLTPDGDA